MSSIQPISTTRVTDVMTRGRLTSQIQADQLELFNLQNQLSTGFRISLPSDDASAAQRAIVLQRTIERKDQAATNLQGARSALVTSDGALNDISRVLNDVKSAGLNAIDDFSGPQVREALIEQIEEVLDTLTNVGNTTFTGTYLFGGSQIATQPYDRTPDYVEYFGDEGTPQTFVDIGFLFDSGVSGDNVFGGISDQVIGQNDLDAQLTPDTRLSDLNGGTGIGENGSIQLLFDPAAVGEPQVTSVVDLSRAGTLADVARLIERNAPAGAEVVAQVSGDGLRIDTSNGTLVINEVADGTTAQRLGLPTNVVASSSIQGSDLDPVIGVTTRLEDLVGVKSRGRLELTGASNDLIISAAQNGAAYNDLTITVIDDPAVSAGSETATYDSGTNTLTVRVESGQTTGEDIANAINTEGNFVAEVDYRDASTVTERGSGSVSASTTPGDDYLNVTDSQGENGLIDLTSGLLITNGPETYTIDTSTAETVEDLLGTLNRPEFGLLATLGPTGDRIDIRTRRSGVDFAIAENGGTTAADLGVLTYRGDSQLADFNRGSGVVVQGDSADETASLNQFTIEISDAGDTQTYQVDISAASTVDDVIAQIGAATGGAITASLSTSGGNGLVLTDNVGAVLVATPASGSVSLGADNLDFTAAAAGSAGNRSFELVFENTGTAGLATTVDGDTITVNLGGSGTETTTTIAASIDAQLAGFTVAPATGGVAISSPLPFSSTVFQTDGGQDVSGAGYDSITISGSAAERLGFFEKGELSVSSTAAQVTSTDRNALEADSVFTTLIRMKDALENADLETVQREVERLDDDLERVNFARGEIGARIQNLDTIDFRLSEESVQLQQALSRDIDADLVDVISDFTIKQASLQASLQVTSSLLQLTVLDFI